MIFGFWVPFLEKARLGTGKIVFVREGGVRD
jgi:hypothetical protein